MRVKEHFKFGNIAINIVLALALFAGQAWVRLETKNELKQYVPKEEFSTYQQAHQELEREVLKNIERNIAEISRRAEQAAILSQENNTMLREMRAEMKHLRVGFVRPEKTPVVQNP